MIAESIKMRQIRIVAKIKRSQFASAAGKMLKQGIMRYIQCRKRIGIALDICHFRIVGYVKRSQIAIIAIDPFKFGIG